MASPSPPSRHLKSLRITSSPPGSPPGANGSSDTEDPSSTSPTLPLHNQNQIPTASSAPPLTEEQRVAALQRELHLLKSMNATLTNLHSSLAVSKGNLQTLQTTISSSAVLLETWTRILSQAEHNARLIADPSWEGAAEDALLAEREEAERKAKAEREREEREQRERDRVMQASVAAEKAPSQGNSRLGMGRGLRGSVGGRRGTGSTGRRATYRGRGRA